MKRLLYKRVMGMVLFTMSLLTVGHSAKVVGVMRGVEGEVTLRHPLGKLKLAEDDLEVFKGTKIKTGSKSRVVLDFFDDSTVTLGSDTLFRVRKKAKVAGKDTVLDLFEGMARTEVHKLGGQQVFKVRSPSAVAGVRGTVFDTMVAQDATLMVQCYSSEGTGIYVETPVGIRDVKPGFSASVSNSGMIKVQKIRVAASGSTKAQASDSAKKQSTGKGKKQSKSNDTRKSTGSSNGKAESKSDGTSGEKADAQGASSDGESQSNSIENNENTTSSDSMSEMVALDKDVASDDSDALPEMTVVQSFADAAMVDDQSYDIEPEMEIEISIEDVQETEADIAEDIVNNITQDQIDQQVIEAQEIKIYYEFEGGVQL